VVDLRIETREIRALEQSLELADRDARRKAYDAVRKAGFEVERRAKINAPVDTGFLMNSINTGFEGDVYSTGFSAEVGPGARYGVFVETGTQNMAPQPYLGPALDEVEPSFVAALQDINPLAPGGGGV
jgi:HK97 gp10 family phage protein